MKKTKAIHLILISAALASCNREFVPVRGSNGQLIDSSLLAEPEYEEVMLPSPCMSCCQNYQPLWSYSFNPLGNLNPFPAGHIYYYHWNKRPPVWVHGYKVIVRSGWGSTGKITTAIS
jgi:hypothetical protein